MATHPPSKRVTIADVARAAGVSPTTVSHSLNGLGKVDPRTRQRVKDVAAELKYRPSVRAQRLRAGRSQSIALLSSMPAGVSAGASRLGFFTEIAMGCAETALLGGYVLVLSPPIGRTDYLAQLDIDGAILLEPTPQDPLQDELIERGIPYVTIDGPGDDTQVDLHHEDAANLLLKHLVERGAKAIGLLLGTSGRLAQRVFRERYLALMERLGTRAVIVEADEADGEPGGYRATAALLSESPDLDALCVPIDAFATGAVRAATDAGRVVGEDLLVATRYDGVRARTSSPPLTALDLHLGNVSRTAVELLLRKLDGGQGHARPPAPSPPALMVRESTASGLAVTSGVRVDANDAD